jgi:hypothetical protein
VINLIILLFIESIGLCSDNGITNGKSLLLITFGSGPDQYSDKTPSSFNFSTTHDQKFASDIKTGWFAFLNAVPKLEKLFERYHHGAQDHTKNDNGGYMYLANVGKVNILLFQSTVNNLCIGLCYEFSMYVANVIDYVIFPSPEPNIRLEVRNAANENQLLAQFSTGNIPSYKELTWSKYGLSFNASSTSVVLLMISNAPGGKGNDLVIDDIELRVCSTNYSGVYPPG